MRLSRRGVLTGVTGLIALGAAGRWARARATGEAVRYLSCADDASRGHYIVGIDGRGGVVFELPLPARGHGMAISPDGATCIAFGRRPGLFATVVDIPAVTVVGTLVPPRLRYFYGHGAFSADGRRLYATESDVESGRGVIGIYDAINGFARLGEFDAGGIGPHEIRLAHDRETLVVAIGGILTNRGREKLNRDTMEPGLAYFNAATGRMLELVAPPPEWHQLSIRHLDIAADGRVVAGMQYQGDAGDSVPLVASHRRGETLEYLRAPPLEERKLKSYVGSIAFDGTGAQIAATSPYGNVLLIWDAKTDKFVGSAPAKDVSGVAPAPGRGFIATGESGAMWGINTTVDAPSRAAERNWDNHLTARGGA